MEICVKVMKCKAGKLGDLSRNISQIFYLFFVSTGVAEELRATNKNKVIHTLM